MLFTAVLSSLRLGPTGSDLIEIESIETSCVSFDKKDLGDKLDYIALGGSYFLKWYHCCLCYY